MDRLPLWVVFLAWVCGVGGLSAAFGRRAARRAAAILSRTRLPTAVAYFAVLTPLVLAEEALTIEVPYFWGILPMLVVFWLFFAVVYLFQRLTRLPAWMAVSAAGTLGWVNEFIIVGRIHQAQGLTLAILGVLCWLIYAVLALLPCLVLEEALRARRAKGTSR